MSTSQTYPLKLDKSRPGAAGLFFAFLGLVVSSIIFLALQLSTKEISQKIAQQELGSRIQRKEFADSGKFLNTLTSSSALKNAYQIIQGRGSHIEGLENRSLIAQSLYKVIELSSNRKFPEALIEVKSMPVVSANALSPDSALSAQNLQEQVLGLRNDLIIANEKLSQLQARESEVSGINSQKRALHHQFNLVADDLAELLGVPAEYKELPGDGESLVSYSSGLLAGMPRLKGLKDEIVDLAGLKTELDTLGAVVGVKGNDIKERFNEQFSSLKATSAALSDDAVALDLRFDSADKGREAASRGVVAIQAKVIRQSATLFDWFSDPQLSPWTELGFYLYGLARIQLAGVTEIPGHTFTRPTRKKEPLPRPKQLP